MSSISEIQMHAVTPETIPHNKRMQSDASKAGAADAKRYEARVSIQVKNEFK
jgi:hypothetical protein